MEYNIDKYNNKEFISALSVLENYSRVVYCK